ncbi:MAG TPA: DUF4167 domain-containing protein [Rhizomicrobium sp.]|nr:DUF4167 domain-containing protein [Rhizomicrobium sp.]
MKRSRRGGRRPQHAGGGGGGGHNNNNNNNGGGGHNPNRTFDSSGPEVKIRGSAANVYEKYLQLARDANANGDRVMAESYLQHAEHYYRIMAAQAQAQAQYQQQQALQQQNNGQNRGNGQGGDGQQPFAGQQPNQSGPSFSLTENEEEGEEEPAE